VLTELKTLYLTRTRVSAEQIAALKRAIPKLMVYGP